MALGAVHSHARGCNCPVLTCQLAALLNSSPVTKRKRNKPLDVPQRHLGQHYVPAPGTLQFNDDTVAGDASRGREGGGGGGSGGGRGVLTCQSNWSLADRCW